ncbi:unnamed protein product [Rhizophagus irregularis]|nr:unnamed protein product [Rhizophagus irregularis]
MEIIHGDLLSYPKQFFENKSTRRFWSIPINRALGISFFIVLGGYFTVITYSFEGSEILMTKSLDLFSISEMETSD